MAILFQYIRLRPIRTSLQRLCNGDKIGSKETGWARICFRKSHVGQQYVTGGCLNRLDSFAIAKFAQSLEVVPGTLAENAGLNSTFWAIKLAAKSVCTVLQVDQAAQKLLLKAKDPKMLWRHRCSTRRKLRSLSTGMQGVATPQKFTYFFANRQKKAR